MPENGADYASGAATLSSLLPGRAGMTSTTCVPMPGQGLVARSGDLIVLTDGLGGDPDPLLAVLTEVAAAGGDGGALVRSAARAALACMDQPAWACAGVTSDGELAVLVHGAATADITVDGGGTVTLTGRGSLLPVSRLLAGGTVVARLGLPGPAAADTRLRLDGGIVRGGGVEVTATAGASAPPAEAPETSALPTGQATPSRPLTFAADPSGALTLISGVGSPLDEGPADADAEAPPRVLVDGVLCARQHFNDPDVAHCRQCGVAMTHGNVERRPRPPLGVLLLDDGAGYTLDADYVLGREPMLDADVAAGRARALRISDPDGTVSRLHLRVRLVGWQVEVSDLGSANGSVLHPVAGPQTRLKPRDPVIIEPGTRVTVGHRSIQYLSDRSG
jgi:hypothetical protein